jgi:hypothetical protein
LQGYREHADRRAARVVRPPVQAQLTVRAPGTCARGCGTCASDALWSPPGCSWMRCGMRTDAGCDAARDLMRLCDVEGSAAQGYREHADRRVARVVRPPVQSLHTVRPPGTCARGCGTCASGARWGPPGCCWMQCGTRSDAHVRRRGFGRAGRSRTHRSPRCPSRSPACLISADCASAGHLRAWVRHLRVR